MVQGLASVSPTKDNFSWGEFGSLDTNTIDKSQVNVYYDLSTCLIRYENINGQNYSLSVITFILRLTPNTINGTKTPISFANLTFQQPENYYLDSYDPGTTPYSVSEPVYYTTNEYSLTNSTQNEYFISEIGINVINVNNAFAFSGKAISWELSFSNFDDSWSSEIWFQVYLHAPASDNQSELEQISLNLQDSGHAFFNTIIIPYYVDNFNQSEVPAIYTQTISSGTANASGYTIGIILVSLVLLRLF